MDKILDQLTEYWNGFVLLIPDLILAIVELVIGIILAKLASRAIRRAMERSKIDQQATLLVTQIAYYAILSVTIVMALSQLGVNVTALVASLGIAGFTIGFALQDVSKNFIAGILLLIQKPFRVGDTIEVTGYTGIVKIIDVRATEMQTLDGRVVIIPSAEVFSSPIVNFSRAVQRRVEIQIGISYNNDLERARQVAVQTLDTLEGVLTQPGPSVNFQAFGNFTIQLTLFFWVDPRATDLVAIRDQAVQAIQESFQKSGVEIPNPAGHLDQSGS